ncbi:MAG: pirin family protein [Actinomycetaceae bacterium]|nr:pirin family protein [Actinomycetaceae bacterium]
MSNPEGDALEILHTNAPCGEGTKVEILRPRKVPLGGLRAMTVSRTIPQRQRSLVGAWCFIDHYGPDRVANSGGMDVAPHPHAGLQTVSWLFEGNITHHDSGDHHAVVRPGEINVMTAGSGICHSEVSTQDTEILHGVQLWIALPAGQRAIARNFYSCPIETQQLSGASAKVFVGSLFGITSDAPTYSPLVGAEIVLDPRASLKIPTDPTFEHAILLDTEKLVVAGTAVGRGELAYLGTDENVICVQNPTDVPARFLLLGGEPYRDTLIMWWNFIGSSTQEIQQMRTQWEAGDARFGKVDGYVSHKEDGRSRIPAPTFPRVSLRPRTAPPPVARPGYRTMPGDNQGA